MRREKRNNNNLEDKFKWGKLVSFIIAIILLIIAIVASMSQEQTVGNLNYNRITNEHNSVESASSDLSKNINGVLAQNSSGGDNEDEDDNEINEIRNSLIISDNTNSANATNTVEAEVSANETNSMETEVSANLTEANENLEDTATSESNITENETQTQTNNDQNTENNSSNENVETQFIFPVEGEVIKEFAKDNLIYSETLEEWITHPGIDIKADRTTVVKATADGTVKSIKNDPRYGLTVTIEHNDGYTSVYSSLLTAEFVKEGEAVTQGQTIGTVGNSSVFEVAEDNHLHFELLKDGSNINPEIYLK